MSVSWYDVLGVAPDATEDEIRTAWREATADLEPTDRRFDLYNKAAKVLLDPAARADYDAGSGDSDGDVDDAGRAAGDDAGRAAGDDAGRVDEPVVAAAATTRRGTWSDDSPDAGERGDADEAEGDEADGLPLWIHAVLLVVVLAVAGTAAFLTFRGAGEPAGEDAVREAQSVLDDNFGDILTYHWDDLEAAHQRASALLTPRYQCEFDRVWALVAEQAAPVEAVVETEVLRSGVVRVGDDADRVEFVALIRNSAVNKSGDQGVGTLLVGVTMVQRDGDWLVDMVDGLATGAPSDDDPCAPGEPSDDAS